MKEKYEKERLSLDVKERAKHRNRISALESRINKRLNSEFLYGKMRAFKNNFEHCTKVLGSHVNEKELERTLLDSLAEGRPLKRQRVDHAFVHTFT